MAYSWQPSADDRGCARGPCGGCFLGTHRRSVAAASPRRRRYPTLPLPGREDLVERDACWCQPVPPAPDSLAVQRPVDLRTADWQNASADLFVDLSGKACHGVAPTAPLPQCRPGREGLGANGVPRWEPSNLDQGVLQWTDRKSVV